VGDRITDEIKPAAATGSMKPALAMKAFRVLAKEQVGSPGLIGDWGFASSWPFDMALAAAA
jgi:hypothetical protein